MILWALVGVGALVIGIVPIKVQADNTWQLTAMAINVGNVTSINISLYKSDGTLIYIEQTAGVDNGNAWARWNVDYNLIGDGDAYKICFNSDCHRYIHQSSNDQTGEVNTVNYFGNAPAPLTPIQQGASTYSPAWNSGYNHGWDDARAGRTNSCSLDHHTQDFCNGYWNGYEDNES